MPNSVHKKNKMNGNMKYLSQHCCRMSKFRHDRAVVMVRGLVLLAILLIVSLSFYRAMKPNPLKLLQDQIVRETEQFRNFENICYAGYCGPWVEEYFMNYFFSKGVVFQRVYLPISWTNCHLKCTEDELHRLREYVLGLDLSKQYFTVLQIDKGLQHQSLDIHVDNDLDLLIFTAGGITRGSKINNIPIPLLKDILSPEGYGKVYEVSFVGTTTHPVRSELEEIYGHMYHFTKTDDWKKVIEESTFSLCPRGFGATSFRLYEAIQLQSIPIYVWDEDLLLPFSEVLDWNSFSIVLHRSEIPTLSKRIEQANAIDMAAALEKVVDHFSYEYTCQYIFNKLSTDLKNL